MPSVYNLPDERDVISRLDAVAPDVPTAALLSQVGGILASVTSEFQSSPGINGLGGTGRRFIPVIETRSYDGSGTSIQRVDDIVPNTAITVNVFSLSITDIVLSDNGYGQGHNTLYRPAYQYPFGIGFGLVGLKRIFPSGINNVAVTATWGFGATAPQDVFEAILCETVARILVIGYVGVAGAGVSLRMADFEINTSAGVSIWPVSSPIAIFHRVWLDTIERYRDTRQMQPMPTRSLRRMY